MSDRVPIVSIPGLLTGHEDLDLLVLPAGTTGRSLTFYSFVRDAPSGGSVSVELRNTTGGSGGEAIQNVIADSTKSDSTTGTITLTGTEAVYLRITAESGSAMNLSGWFELDQTAVAVAVLTNLTRVKRHGNIDVSTYDTLLTDLINGVSTAMQRYMGRDIVSTAYTAELASSAGQEKLYTKQRPILASPAPVIRDQGTTVDTSTYDRLGDEGAFLAITDDVAGAWGAGSYRYSIDYSAGWAAVPEDLVLAATKQVLFEFKQTAEGGGRIGSLSKALESGGVTTWAPDEWLRMVRQIMDHYRNAL